MFMFKKGSYLLETHPEISVGGVLQCSGGGTQGLQAQETMVSGSCRDGRSVGAGLAA